MISTSSITTSPDSSKILYQSLVGKISHPFVRKTNYLIAIAASTSKMNLEISYKFAQDRISQGDYVDQPNETGKTALYFAAKFSQMELAKLYLEKGADPNVQDLEGMTPFHIACCCASIEMVELLVEEGAFLFQPDNQGDTPLHWAVREGQSEEVILFLVKQDPTIILVKNQDDETPFDFAKEFGEDTMIKIFEEAFKLLEKNAETDSQLDKYVKDYNKKSAQETKHATSFVPRSPVTTAIGMSV